MNIYISFKITDALMTMKYKYYTHGVKASAKERTGGIVISLLQHFYGFN